MGLKNCPKAFKQVYYERYVDVIFVSFEKLEQVLRYVNYEQKAQKDEIFV